MFFSRRFLYAETVFRSKTPVISVRSCNGVGKSVGAPKLPDDRKPHSVWLLAKLPPELVTSMQNTACCQKNGIRGGGGGKQLLGFYTFGCLPLRGVCGGPVCAAEASRLLFRSTFSHNPTFTRSVSEDRQIISRVHKNTRFKFDAPEGRVPFLLAHCS